MPSAGRVYAAADVVAGKDGTPRNECCPLRPSTLDGAGPGTKGLDGTNDVTLRWGRYCARACWLRVERWWGKRNHTRGKVAGGEAAMGEVPQAPAHCTPRRHLAGWGATCMTATHAPLAACGGRLAALAAGTCRLHLHHQWRAATGSGSARTRFPRSSCCTPAGHTRVGGPWWWWWWWWWMVAAHEDSRSQQKEQRHSALRPCTTRGGDSGTSTRVLCHNTYCTYTPQTRQVRWRWWRVAVASLQSPARHNTRPVQPHTLTHAVLPCTARST